MIDTTQEPTLLADAQDDADPTLALLSAAAVSGLTPAGPEFRQRAPIRLATHPQPSITGPLCATDSGFTPHAATVARGDDLRGQEALLRYHAERNHQGLATRLLEPKNDNSDANGRVVRRKRLGGILSYYQREAA